MQFAVPVGLCCTHDKTYKNMEMLLKHIQYTKYNWDNNGDLQVVVLLHEMQLRYAKHFCYICEWHNQSRECYYIKNKWALLKNLIPGQKNFIHEPLVDLKKIFLPLHHIQLGLMTFFIKAMNKEGEGFVI